MVSKVVEVQIKNLQQQVSEVQNSNVTHVEALKDQIAKLKSDFKDIVKVIEDLKNIVLGKATTEEDITGKATSSFNLVSNVVIDLNKGLLPTLGRREMDIS